MSAPIMEKARAFDLLAPHLSEATRQSVAEAIAAELRPHQQAPQVPPPHETLSLFTGDHARDRGLVPAFLRARGYQKARLVRASALLCKLLDEEYIRRYGELPREDDAALIPVVYDDHERQVQEA